MNSLEKYRQGCDDMLERNKAEAEESRKKLEDENEQLRKQVCSAEPLCLLIDDSNVLRLAILGFWMLLSRPFSPIIFTNPKSRDWRRFNPRISGSQKLV